MASGAVRELITTVKFVLDRASESKVKNAIQGLKQQLNGVAKNQAKIKINADTASATSAIRNVKSQLNSLNGKTVTTHVNTRQTGVTSSGTGSKAAGLADSGGTLMAAGVAAAAPLALSLNTAMDFEAAMSKVQAITNSTDADMERLTATARSLGASTQYSATEAAAAMSYLGMAGWKTEQIIAGMPGLLDLAAASGEDLARVSDIVSDDLTAFKMPAEQAGHMADVMAAASTNANTNVAMMGETFKYAGAIAGALGYSLEDVAAATGLMANSGIKGEMAGTALRSVMTRLVSPPKEAAMALDRLGISAKNSDGTLKPFRQQMQELRQAFAGLSDAEKSETANSIAGQEAMSGFLAVVNASDEDFNKMTKAVDNANGAAKRMADTMSKNAKGDIKRLKSSLEELEQIIGERLLKAFDKAIQGATKFTQKLGEFAKQNPKITSAIVGIVAAVGAILVALGAIGLAAGAIGSGIAALQGAFAAIGGVLSIGFAPLLAILAAVAAAIYFVGQHWDTVVQWFQPGIDSIKEGISSLQKAWQDLQPFIAAIMPLLQIIVTLIGGAIVGALSIMFRWWSFIFNQIAALIEWIAGKLGGLGQIIQTLASGLNGLIDKAMQLVGIQKDIGGLNGAVVDTWIKPLGGGDTYNIQTNNNSFSDMAQVWPTQQASNSYFGEYQ